MHAGDRNRRTWAPGDRPKKLDSVAWRPCPFIPNNRAVMRNKDDARPSPRKRGEKVAEGRMRGSANLEDQPATAPHPGPPPAGGERGSQRRASPPSSTK